MSQLGEKSLEYFLKWKQAWIINKIYRKQKNQEITQDGGRVTSKVKHIEFKAKQSCSC